MSHIPFVLSLDNPPYYGHDIFPNRIFRRLHERHHDALDIPTLGMMARLGPHAHHVAAQKHIYPSNKDFEVHLDVGLFQPEEISVKVVNDHIVVEGQHEEREDDFGSISRHFKRRYKLPEGYDVHKIVTTLSSDGALTVKVPKPLESDKGEIIIPIQRTGPAELFLRNGVAANATPNGEKKENEK